MRVAVLGDSITQGIGSKKVNYCNYLEEELKDSIVKNFALTGTTIKYAFEIKDKVVKFNPDVLIVFYGNVDALPRVNPNSKLYNLLPKRYKELGMLDARALYSSKPIKKILQKIDSSFRYRLKKILINTSGSIQWVNLIDFELFYRRLLSSFKNADMKLILISTVPMYEEFFPKANEEFIKYNQIISKLAKEFDGEYIDLYNYLRGFPKREIYLSDYYHPNEYGYRVIADLIIEYINSTVCKVNVFG